MNIYNKKVPAQGCSRHLDRSGAATERRDLARNSREHYIPPFRCLSNLQSKCLRYASKAFNIVQ